MAKTIIREVIIALLVCLAILLVLSVMLYGYMPTNKIIPEVTTYETSREVKAEINSSSENETDESIQKYEINATDINTYQKNNNTGKVNPFAAPGKSSESEDENTGSNGTTSNGTTSQPGNSNSASSSNDSTGKLFDNPTSK